MAMRRNVEFQSAPPVRGATFPSGRYLLSSIVSIRAPRERGDEKGFQQACQIFVSIRAPRERGDRANVSSIELMICFNPRPP